MNIGDINIDEMYVWEHFDSGSGQYVRERVTVVAKCGATRTQRVGSPSSARNRAFPEIRECDYWVDIETAAGEKKEVKCGELRKAEEKEG